MLIYMYHRVHSSICLLCLTPVRSLLNYLRTMHYANGYLTRGICFIILLRGMLARRYTKLGISVRFVRLNKHLLYSYLRNQPYLYGLIFDSTRWLSHAMQRSLLGSSTGPVHTSSDMLFADSSFNNNNGFAYHKL